jgi:hypothetical protein
LSLSTFSRLTRLYRSNKLNAVAQPQLSTFALSERTGVVADRGSNRSCLISGGLSTWVGRLLHPENQTARNAHTTEDQTPGRRRPTRSSRTRTCTGAIKRFQGGNSQSKRGAHAQAAYDAAPRLLLQAHRAIELCEVPIERAERRSEAHPGCLRNCCWRRFVALDWQVSHADCLLMADSSNAPNWFETSGR